MAIDYKKEWKKLHNTHGRDVVSVAGTMVRLHELMDGQIRNTIHAREKLMQEYIKENMTTDIGRVTNDVYNVKLCLHSCPNGSINVGRINFDEWCKRKNSQNVWMQKFGLESASYENMNIICAECGERLGKHIGTECPKGGK